MVCLQSQNAETDFKTWQANFDNVISNVTDPQQVEEMSERGKVLLNLHMTKKLKLVSMQRDQSSHA